MKNLIEKVISEVKKEGEEEAAKALKGSKYILMAKVSTRRERDRDDRAGKVVSRGNGLFNKPEAAQRDGNRARYEEPVSRNGLLAACDIAREMLAKAYAYRQEKRMRDMMEEGLPRHGEQALRVVRQARRGPHGRHRGARKAPDQQRQSRGHQQHDQVPAPRRLPRRRVLLPQDLRREQALLAG